MRVYPHLEAIRATSNKVLLRLEERLENVRLVDVKRRLTVDFEFKSNDVRFLNFGEIPNFLGRWRSLHECSRAAVRALLQNIREAVLMHSPGLDLVSGTEGKTQENDVELSVAPTPPLSEADVLDYRGVTEHVLSSAGTEYQLGEAQAVFLFHIFLTALQTLNQFHTTDVLQIAKLIGLTTYSKARFSSTITDNELKLSSLTTFSQLVNKHMVIRTLTHY